MAFGVLPNFAAPKPPIIAEARSVRMDVILRTTLAHSNALLAQNKPQSTEYSPWQSTSPLKDKSNFQHVIASLFGESHTF